MSYAEGRVQSSDTGQGLGFATLADNFGNIASADAYGLFYTTVAYPGYQITASAGGYYSKTYEFSSSDVSGGWVTIRLDPKPPSSGGGGGGGW